MGKSYPYKRLRCNPHRPATLWPPHHLPLHHYWARADIYFLSITDLVAMVTVLLRVELHLTPWLTAICVYHIPFYKVWTLGTTHTMSYCFLCKTYLLLHAIFNMNYLKPKYGYISHPALLTVKFWPVVSQLEKFTLKNIELMEAGCVEEMKGSYCICLLILSLNHITGTKRPCHRILSIWMASCCT